jgi:thioredoxin-related protein
MFNKFLTGILQQNFVTLRLVTRIVRNYNMKKYVVVLCLFMALTVNAQEIKWYSFEEAVELNKKEPKKILIDVYTDWCGYCKIMDKNTFGNKIIADYMNKAYYPVKFNAEQKEDVKYNEQTYKFVAQGARGFHELAYALLNGQMSYPSVVFLDEKIRIIHIQKGFVQPKPFDEIIKYIGGNFYETTSWEDWRSGYSSPFSSN